MKGKVIGALGLGGLGVIVAADAAVAREADPFLTVPVGG